MGVMSGDDLQMFVAEAMHVSGALVMLEDSEGNTSTEPKVLLQLHGQWTDAESEECVHLPIVLDARTVDRVIFGIAEAAQRALNENRGFGN